MWKISQKKKSFKPSTSFFFFSSLSSLWSSSSSSQLCVPNTINRVVDCTALHKRHLLCSRSLYYSLTWSLLFFSSLLFFFFFCRFIFGFFVQSIHVVASSAHLRSSGICRKHERAHSNEFSSHEIQFEIFRFFFSFQFLSQSQYIRLRWRILLIQSFILYLFYLNFIVVVVLRSSFPQTLLVCIYTCAEYMREWNESLAWIFTQTLHNFLVGPNLPAPTHDHDRRKKNFNEKIS